MSDVHRMSTYNGCGGMESYTLRLACESSAKCSFSYSSVDKGLEL